MRLASPKAHASPEDEVRSLVEAASSEFEAIKEAVAALQPTEAPLAGQVMPAPPQRLPLREKLSRAS
jgi:hypothetical protein